MEYLVVFERSSEGWGAYAPDLPGLGVVGETFEEAEQLITNGIAMHVELLKERGEPVPNPAARSAYRRPRAARGKETGA